MGPGMFGFSHVGSPQRCCSTGDQLPTLRLNQKGIIALYGARGYFICYLELWLGQFYSLVMLLFSQLTPSPPWTMFTFSLIAQ